MTSDLEKLLRERELKYNDPVFFEEDPISFPRRFATAGASLQDIEIAAVFAAHFAWGRRSMIVRDCTRLFDEMQWKPFAYVSAGDYRNDNSSAHRTVKWCDVARICKALAAIYSGRESLEGLSVQEIRSRVYSQKEDPNAANKKINMMRRWMTRRDGKVDLGLWKNTNPAELLMPLDVHVHRQAMELGLTSRKCTDARTVEEITSAFREIWPEDPVRGDFALFGYAVENA